MNKTTSSRITQWHGDQKPRERLLQRGAEHLSAAELLAVCFGSGLAGENAVMMASRLLQRFGGIDGLLQAPMQELRACRGIGNSRVALVKAIHQITLRHAEERFNQQRESMSDVAAVSRYLQRRLGHEGHEQFACLYLDTRHRLIAYEVPFRGSINRAYVFPRPILKRCLELNAAAVILAHNHPSGVAEPSQADISLTRDLVDLLAKLDIKVLDHIVVAAQQTVSLAKRGLLPATTR